MKARNAPAAMPRPISGNVTRRKVKNGPAPRLSEASSKAGSSCARLAIVVRSTNGTHTATGPGSRGGGGGGAKAGAERREPGDRRAQHEWAARGDVAEHQRGERERHADQAEI